MGPAEEEPNHDPQSARAGRAKSTQRRGATGRGRPRRRKSECVERRREGSVKDKRAKPGWKALPPFPPPSVSLKSLTEAEGKLVFGDELDAAQTLAKSPASSVSQLMCQASEIVGPSRGPNLSFLPQIDKWLHVALQDADSYYKLKKYVIAANRFTTALELCSKGAVLGEASHADYEDISKVIGFIESKLVACYLRMRRPDLALNHSHRSIYLNPVHYQNHFRQAVVQRLLGHPREAARSAMIADFVYWLSGGTDQSISKLIKQYWQAMLEHAIATEQTFSVMYTPCDDNPTEESMEATKELSKKRHPAFTQYLFTDPSGTHFLPQTTSWTGMSCQRYTLTLGFRRSEDGSFLDKLLTRKCPVFTGSRAPFAPPSKEDVERMSDSLERKILPVLDFLKCTKLAVGFSAGSGLVERLQHAEYLGQLKRTKEQTHALQQALAELAVTPYLQDLSHCDSQLLQALMADSMDTLEGRQTDKERVWNEMQKVGLLEELLHEQEGTYLRGRAHLRSRAPRADRKPRARARVKPTPTSERSPHPATHPPSRERRPPLNRPIGRPRQQTLIHPGRDNQDSELMSRRFTKTHLQQ